MFTNSALTNRPLVLGSRSSLSVTPIPFYFGCNLMRRFSMFLILVFVVVFCFGGCASLFHNLQPHRLMKLNHSLDGTPVDAYQ